MKLLPLGLRLIIGGCVLCVVGVALIGLRGYNPAYIIFPIVGVVLIAVGVVWRGPKGAKGGEEENKPGVW